MKYASYKTPHKKRAGFSFLAPTMRSVTKCENTYPFSSGPPPLGCLQPPITTDKNFEGYFAGVYPMGPMPLDVQLSEALKNSSYGLFVGGIAISTINYKVPFVQVYNSNLRNVSEGYSLPYQVSTSAEGTDPALVQARFGPFSPAGMLYHPFFGVLMWGINFGSAQALDSLRPLNYSLGNDFNALQCTTQVGNMKNGYYGGFTFDDSLDGVKWVVISNSYTDAGNTILDISKQTGTRFVKTFPPMAAYLEGDEPSLGIPGFLLVGANSFSYIPVSQTDILDGSVSTSSSVWQDLTLPLNCIDVQMEYVGKGIVYVYFLSVTTTETSVSCQTVNCLDLTKGTSAFTPTKYWGDNSTITFKGKVPLDWFVCGGNIGLVLADNDCYVCNSCTTSAAVITTSIGKTTLLPSSVTPTKIIPLTSTSFAFAKANGEKCFTLLSTVTITNGTPSGTTSSDSYCSPSDISGGIRFLSTTDFQRVLPPMVAPFMPGAYSFSATFGLAFPSAGFITRGGLTYVTSSAEKCSCTGGTCTDAYCVCPKGKMSVTSACSTVIPLVPSAASYSPIFSILAPSCLTESLLTSSGGLGDVPFVLLTVGLFSVNVGDTPTSRYGAVAYDSAGNQTSRVGYSLNSFDVGFSVLGFDYHPSLGIVALGGNTKTTSGCLVLTENSDYSPVTTISRVSETTVSYVGGQKYNGISYSIASPALGAIATNFGTGGSYQFIKTCPPLEAYLSPSVTTHLPTPPYLMVIGFSPPPPNSAITNPYLSACFFTISGGKISNTDPGVTSSQNLLASMSALQDIYFRMNGAGVALYAIGYAEKSQSSCVSFIELNSDYKSFKGSTASNAAPLPGYVLNYSTIVDATVCGEFLVYISAVAPASYNAAHDTCGKNDCMTLSVWDGGRNSSNIWGPTNSVTFSAKGYYISALVGVDSNTAKIIGQNSSGYSYVFASVTISHSGTLTVNTTSTLLTNSSAGLVKTRLSLSAGRSGAKVPTDYSRFAQNIWGTAGSTSRYLLATGTNPCQAN